MNIGFFRDVYLARKALKKGNYLSCERALDSIIERLESKGFSWNENRTKEYWEKREAKKHRIVCAPSKTSGSLRQVKRMKVPKSVQAVRKRQVFNNFFVDDFANYSSYCIYLGKWKVSGLDSSEVYEAMKNNFFKKRKN